MDAKRPGVLVGRTLSRIRNLCPLVRPAFVSTVNSWNLAAARVIPGRDEGRNKGWENLVYTAEVRGIETRTDQV